MRAIAIVGASLAGLSTARALRKQGYDGVLSIVGAEAHRPYDRPPLSKSLLAGIVTEVDIALEAENEQLGADWRLGVRAVALDPGRRAVSLSDGSELRVDGVVLATGAAPRLPWPVVPRGVHVLRTLEDCRALRERLLPGSRLVVVGAGFIGSEVAATAHELGVRVTVLEAADTALSAVLGKRMGAAVAARQLAHGVDLRCASEVTGFDEVAGEVSAVRLAGRPAVPADTVLVGVGVSPAVSWLTGSGLAIDPADGVRCDAFGATGIAEVVAVGDCAAWFDPVLGRQQRLEHWTAARERAAIAAATLLSGGVERRTGRAPYFWSDQYGTTIQLAGHPGLADEVAIEQGSPDDGDFLAVYRRAGVEVAVLAVGCGRAFMAHRRALGNLDGAAPVGEPA